MVLSNAIQVLHVCITGSQLHMSPEFKARNSHMCTYLYVQQCDCAYTSQINIYCIWLYFIYCLRSAKFSSMFASHWDLTPCNAGGSQQLLSRDDWQLRCVVWVPESGIQDDLRCFPAWKRCGNLRRGWQYPLAFQLWFASGACCGQARWGGHQSKQPLSVCRSRRKLALNWRGGAKRVQLWEFAEILCVSTAFVFLGYQETSTCHLYPYIWIIVDGLVNLLLWRKCFTATRWNVRWYVYAEAFRISQCWLPRGSVGVLQPLDPPIFIWTNRLKRTALLWHFCNVEGVSGGVMSVIWMVSRWSWVMTSYDLWLDS